MQLTNIEKISLFTTTKQERESIALEIIDNLQQGQTSPLLVHLHIKNMEDMVKAITSNTIYKKLVVEEAEKQDGKSFQFHNAKFEVKETGVKYDYSKCEDIVYNRMLQESEELAAKIKAREAMLKSVSPKGMIVTDEETGETFTVYPPAKSSTTNVAVTLK